MMYYLAGAALFCSAVSGWTFGRWSALSLPVSGYLSLAMMVAGFGFFISATTLFTAIRKREAVINALMTLRSKERGNAAPAQAASIGTT